MTTNTTRRAVMAGLAAAPVAGLPAMAGVVAEADPIFAAFAEFECEKAAEDLAWKAASDLYDAGSADAVIVEAEYAASGLYDARAEAEVALFETPPTSRAGALRLLRHLADFLDDDDVVNDLYLGDVVGDAIRNAIKVLERETLV